MKTVISFLTFLLMLLGLNAFAIANGNASHVATTRDSKKSETVSFIRVVQQEANFTGNGLPNESKYLICEEIKDEDESGVSSGKCRSQAGLYTTLFYQSFLNVRLNLARHFPLFWPPVTLRYILHGTLRI